MRTMIRTVSVVLLGLAVSTSGGCVALAVGAAAGAGAYAYQAGKLTASLDASLDSSYDAARAALKDLELKEASAAKDAFEAKITAKTADNTDVTIHLEKKGDKLTEMTIRVGTFGDQAKSVAIHDKTRGHL